MQQSVSPVVDTAFMSQLETILSSRFNDVSLSATSIAKSLFLSRSTLYRKLKYCVGKSMKEYLNEIRFQRAKDLLASTPKPLVKEVANAVGYQKVSYFSKQFHKRYGIRPSKIILED